MKADPLISVITVCYNSADTIFRTIDSLRNQTSQNFEYIVVDGQSTDQTISILQENQSLIDHLVIEPDDGIYYAMNKGIKLAKGQYISFLNSDDCYLDNTIQLVSEMGTKADIIYGNMIKERLLNGEVLRKLIKPDLTRMKETMSIFHPSTFVKRELFDRFGPYDLKYKLASDYHWLLRAFRANVEFVYLDKPLSIFDSQGVSNFSCESYREAAQIHEEFDLDSDTMWALFEKCKKKSKRARIIQELSKLPGLKQLYEHKVKKNWS